MAIRVFNVSGSPLPTDTKDNPNVRMKPGSTIDLEGYHKIGNRMRKQIDQKLIKIRPITQATPIPEADVPKAGDKAKADSAKPKKGIVGKVKEALTGKKESIVPPVDLKTLADSSVSNDDFIKAVMQHMISVKDNLGRDGKPNQPVLESIVKELRPSIKNVKADRRDRLYAEIKKKEDSSG